MIIIIPLGGIGSRFKENGYTQPKALINVFGKSILFYLIDCINKKNINFIYIPYNKEYFNYRFEDLLRKKYSEINFRFLCLENNTGGAAETLKIALENLDVEDQPILSLDGDNFFSTDVVKIWNGENMVLTQCDKSNLDCFSFVSVNDDNFITDIVEKNRISNIACVGAYGFNSYKDLLKLSREVVEKNLKFKNEFYISNIIKLMINKDYKIKTKVIDKKDWHCLGTPLQIKYFYNNFPKICCIDNEEKINNLRVCFDLDNTLVTYPKIKNDYTSVEPISKNIEFLKYLKKFGTTIIIYTARRMKTHKGNNGKILADIGKITFDTLEKFDIPYDELYFGKPFADFYIDDLGVNCFGNIEKNLGFYMENIKPRDFNSIEINKMETVTKKSNDLEGEIFYYNNIPKDLKDLFPIYINNYGVTEYTIEKIEGITCSNLYVSKLLSDNTLKHIMNSIKRIQDYNVKLSDDIDIYFNYLDKVKTRYKNYDYSNFLKIEEVYEKIVYEMEEYKKSNLGKKKMIHGDPVMSNIILNNHGKIKFIDMRGKVGDKLTLQGDWLYDWAKLYQSILGYDFILLNKQIDIEYICKMKSVFEEYFIKLYSEKDMINVRKITNSLLFSLIPLHDNEKCIKYYHLICLS